MEDHSNYPDKLRKSHDHLTQIGVPQMSEANATATGSAQAENAAEPEFTLQNVTERYFAPNELQEAAEYLNAVTPVVPTGEMKMNFDGQNVAEGYGLYVLPLKKRSETAGEGNVTIGVAVCQVPAFETIMNYGDGKGLEFVRDAVLGKIGTKIATAFRPRQGETNAEKIKREASVPSTIEAFLTSARGDGSLKTYTELASDFVAGLKRIGLKYITPAILRQVLSSHEFASTQFPKIPGDKWVIILDKMIDAAKAKRLDPAILQHWKDTRDARGVAEVEDIDIEEFEKTLSKMEG